MSENRKGKGMGENNAMADPKVRAKSAQNNSIAQTTGDIVGLCTKTGKELRFKTAKEAREAGFNDGNIRNAIRGHFKTSQGYTWTREQLT